MNFGDSWNLLSSHNILPVLQVPHVSNRLRCILRLRLQFGEATSFTILLTKMLRIQFQAWEEHQFVLNILISFLMPTKLRGFAISVANAYHDRIHVFVAIVVLQFRNRRLALELRCQNVLQCLLVQECHLAFSQIWSLNLVRQMLRQVEGLLAIRHLPVLRR